MVVVPRGGEMHAPSQRRPLFTVVIMLFILYMIMKETWVTLHLYNYGNPRLPWAKQGKGIFKDDIKTTAADDSHSRSWIRCASYACLRATDICPPSSSVDASGRLVA